MTEQLNYFSIDGAFGGNQAWFKNVVMYIGGCAAAAACDSCIYFGREFHRPELYPYDLDHLDQDDYRRFSQQMKPYIPPRVKGVHKLEWYMDGFGRYLKDIGAEITMEGFSGRRSYQEARDMIKEQIHKGYPIPYLLLQHRDRVQFKDFIWHWFMIVGYREEENEMVVLIATYGQRYEFSLTELWDTGYDEKGGFIRYINV